MAQVKILAVNKRFVTVDILWDDGLAKKNYTISNVPVEDITLAQKYLFEHIYSLHDAVKAEADRIAYENPTPDPKVLAAVGRTFDNNGKIIA